MSRGPRHLNPGAGGMTRRSLLPGSGREMTRARTWQRGEKQIRRGLGSRAGGSWPRRVRQKKVASWFQTWAVAQGTAEGALSVTSALDCEVSEARPGGTVRSLEMWFHSLEERSESEVHSSWHLSLCWRSRQLWPWVKEPIKRFESRCFSAFTS